MDLYNLLAGFIGAHQALLIFLGSFFFGDTVILSFSVLMAHSVVSPLKLFVFGFLGTIISDSIWYALGNRLNRTDYVRKKKHLISKIRALTGKNPFMVLLFAKFMYGTRIMFIIYLSMRKTSFWKFLAYNSAGTVIWLLSLMAIGWMAGAGALNLIPFLKKGEVILTLIIALAVGLKLFSRWLTKRITA